MATPNPIDTAFSGINGAQFCVKLTTNLQNLANGTAIEDCAITPRQLGSVFGTLGFTSGSKNAVGESIVSSWVIPSATYVRELAIYVPITCVWASGTPQYTDTALYIRDTLLTGTIIAGAQFIKRNDTAFADRESVTLVGRLSIPANTAKTLLLTVDSNASDLINVDLLPSPFSILTGCA